MLFRELPYLERPKAAARAGFGTIETWWPGEDVAAWADEVARLGLGVAVINSDGGDIDAGERGFLNEPARRGEAIMAFRAAAALARRVGCTRINVLVGREQPGRPRRAQVADMLSALSDCAAIADEEEIAVLVEPINELDVPGYLVPSASVAAELIHTIASSNVRLLYDAYHAARAGADPCRDVARFAPLIGHVQYADCPGRGAPGTGNLDLAAFVEALGNAGYSGPVGLEFDPAGPTAEALERLPW
jgi:hydroxypyruvate isomerase